jgi:hypothetical protein
MCICIAVAFVIPERPAIEGIDEETGETVTTYMGHGYDHAEFATMDVGGPGKDRHEHIIWLVWVLGALICIFFTTCLAFGVRRHEVVGTFGKPIAIGGAIYLATWTMLMLSYNRFMNGEGLDERFLLLPKPTAWMIYGIWGIPAFFIIVFMFKFHSQYWNEDLEKEFNAILARRDARNGGGDE